MAVLKALAIAIGLVASVLSGPCPTQDPPSTDTSSGGFDFTYPWPIRYQELETQNQTLCQAYMDIAPKASRDKGETIVMLHGKNFCGATWEATARVMHKRGYRVILPDQIGFCKSDKPDSYAFSLHQLALNTKTILEQNVDVYRPITVMGHSMGGMLASRFALMYPDLIKRLIMVDPIGLEDWKAKGVPYQPIDDIYQQEASSNYSSIRGYEQATYYVGEWRRAYDRWVNMLLRLYDGPLGDLYARIQARITDMVYTQPVIYEFPLLGRHKTLLIVGDQDNTAIGKTWSPPDVQQVLGRYDVLAREAVDAIGPNATLVHYPDLGHSPQISNPDRFHADLLAWLDAI